MRRLHTAYLLTLLFSGAACIGGGPTSSSSVGPDAGAGTGTGDAAAIASFSCTGESVVWPDQDHVYHLVYTGNGTARLSESNAHGTTVVAPNLSCAVVLSGPPPAPAPATAQPADTISDISCESWTGESPATGFEASIHIGDPTQTTAQGTVSFCIDDNCPVDSLMPNGYMTRLQCKNVHFSQ